MAIDHTFGRRVREAREARSLFQQDVVDMIKALGVKRPICLRTLKRIESGKHHTFEPRARVQLVRVMPELR